MDKVEVNEYKSRNQGTLAALYNNCASTRDPFLQRARASSELTIPMLMPPEGHTQSTIYSTPYQSIGARAVNNLASKLLLALLPPNSPFFRLVIDDFDIAEIAESQRGKVEEALGSIERSAMQEIETKAVRVPVYEGLKQLIVTGNVLLHFPKGDDNMRVFRLDRYVVKRDAMGNILEIVTKESLSPKMLPSSVQMLVSPQEDYGTKDYDLYTCVKLDGNKWSTYQEIEGFEVPESRGTYPIDKNPYLALRFSKIDGEDYGRGYVEEYIGDLKSLEGLSKAIVQGSAAAAKLLFLVKPNGTTKLRSLAESPSGAIVQGDANDVSVLQMEKFNDFRVTLETMKTITERLSYAFLLNSAVQRQAERVTAEEVRYMASELEGQIGNIYSILSVEFQLPMVKILLNRMEQSGKMPKFPKDSIKPQIITGVEALGRGQDLNKLGQFMQHISPLGEEVILRELNIGDYISRLGASLGIDTNGLVKTDEQKQQEMQQREQQKQQMMQQDMMKNVVEGSAPGALKSVMDGMQNMPPEAMEQIQQQAQQMAQQQQAN